MHHFHTVIHTQSDVLNDNVSYSHTQSDVLKDSVSCSQCYRHIVRCVNELLYHFDTVTDTQSGAMKVLFSLL